MSSSETERLPLIVVSGPSGSGKSTLVRRLCEADPSVRRSVSATTRPPRHGEKHGRDYYFLSAETFTERVKAGKFIEHAVYGDHRYGTLRSEVEQISNMGNAPLLEIEVQGTAQVLQHSPDAITIWIMPPSWEVLERRLRKRKTESEERIQARLRRAQDEIKHLHIYRYVVINQEGRASEAVDQMRSILTAEACRLTKVRQEAILREFERNNHA